MSLTFLSNDYAHMCGGTDRRGVEPKRHSWVLARKVPYNRGVYFVSGGGGRKRRRLCDERLGVEALCGRRKACLRARPVHFRGCARQPRPCPCRPAHGHSSRMPRIVSMSCCVKPSHCTYFWMRAAKVAPSNLSNDFTNAVNHPRCLASFTPPCQAVIW